MLCDVDTLRTLTPEIFSDGMAEAIKYGLIKDQKLFEMIAEQDISDILENMIYRCIQIKAQVVEADEFDKGERMLLNFGHTIGHAIERQYHYQTYTHGSAVGIGMVYISAISEQLGLTPNGTTERIKRCLQKYKLPCSVKITPEQILNISSNNKKRDKSERRGERGERNDRNRDGESGGSRPERSEKNPPKGEQGNEPRERRERDRRGRDRRNRREGKPAGEHKPGEKRPQEQRKGERRENASKQEKQGGEPNGAQ